MENVNKCALCGMNKANKPNTHYLTDAIIKSAISVDEKNTREKSSYYTMSSDKIGMLYGFQRNTPQMVIERNLEREPTKEEIENAKKNPYSVDNVFCSDCEKLFTKIEESFVNDVLPKLRTQTQQKINALSLEECKTIRLFFILQCWRAHVCDSNFKLDANVAEKFRQFILNQEKASVDELKQYPLSVTYILTKEADCHTNHHIAVFSGCNPYLLIMNDFIIQLYDSPDKIRFDNLFGVNENDYLNFINYDEESFQFKIIYQSQWEKIAITIYREIFIPKIKATFCIECHNKLGILPDCSMIKEFLHYFEENRRTLGFSEEDLMESIGNYLTSWEHNKERDGFDNFCR